MEYFDLDSTKLDAAWRGQPKHVYKATEKIAELRAEVEKAKAKIALTKANVSLEARQNPEEFGIDKLTEAALLTAVASNKRVVAAEDKLIQAKFELEKWEGVLLALEHRKRALENLVTLHGQGYFSEPSLSGEARRRVEDSEMSKVRGGLARKDSKRREES